MIIRYLFETPNTIHIFKNNYKESCFIKTILIYVTDFKNVDNN